jgi:hypothetical protein
MARSISISTIHEDQARAAETLSAILTKLGYGHAFIGGFAWSLLGSERPTQMSPKLTFVTILHGRLTLFGEHDIDILIEKRDIGLDELRGKLTLMDRHFAEAGIHLYYVKVCRLLSLFELP